MSIPALGVERVISYPRVLVEPLLWLAVVAGGMWLMVAVNLRSMVSADGQIDARLGTLSAALALVLLLNGAAALALQGQKGWASRGVAVFAGAGLVISGFAFPKIDGIDPDLRHFLVWGSFGAGALLVALALTRWRVHETNLGKRPPGTFALVIVGLLGAAIATLGWVAFRAYGLGLTGATPGSSDGWNSLVPALSLMAGLLSAVGSVWRRAWWTAAGLLVASVIVAEFAVLASR